MRKISVFMQLAYMVMMVIPGLAYVTAEPPLHPGHWIGGIAVPGIEKLTIVFNIEYDGDTYSATCDSPDQNVTGIPVEAVTVTENRVKIDIPAVAAWFEGEIQPGGTVMKGKWNQGGMALDCEVTLSETAYMVNRPQHPESPFPYNVREVVFTNPEVDIELSGTLTIPEGDGPFPGVVLVAGSGPHGRDEMVFGHKPFLVLSDYLTRNTIAVLRYDKRGIGESKGDYGAATTRDFASDAVAAVTFLRGLEQTDPGRIGIVGHSEGGLIAPMVAAEYPGTIDFMVLMAPPGVPGFDLLPVQLEKILTLTGSPPEEIDEARKQQDQFFAILREETDPDRITARITELVKKRYAEMSEEEKVEAGMTEDVMIRNAVSAHTPWLRYFLFADPGEYLRKTSCPVLALWGEKDAQVLPEQNRPEVEKALQKAGNTNATFIVFPDLNHLFQTAETGTVGEYNQIEETLSPVVLKTIGDWILTLNQEKE
jgi:uncharacterized protein